MVAHTSVYDGEGGRRKGLGEFEWGLSRSVSGYSRSKVLNSVTTRVCSVNNGAIHGVFEC